MAVEAVFWFHPLVWWLGARLMEEREQACDEEVLRMGSEVEAYAEGILKVCELYLQSPLKCVAGVTGANLKKRIEAIVANRPMRNLSLPKKVGLVIAAALAIAIPVILGITNAPELRARAQSIAKPDLTGTWQGKLMVPQAPNGEIRIVFKILKADEGGPGEPPKPPERADSLPDLFTAIQQQLGLKLESTKAQVDILVIDKVEKPSEN
jgi:hypothetical protein